ACTVPALRRSETSSSATTPGNALLTCLTSSRNSSGAAARGPAIAASVLTEVVLKIGGGHQLERDPHEAWNALAPGQLQCRVDRAGALSGGILKNGCLEISGFHGGKSIGGGVDPHHDCCGQQFCLSQGLDGSDGHFIVVGQTHLRA